MIVDAHLDLAMNAIEWNRDLSRPIDEIRSRERGQTDRPDRGNATVSFGEMHPGGVRLCVATQIARFSALGHPYPGWHSQEQAWAMTQAQLAWYRAIEDAGELVPITNADALARHLARRADADHEGPLGYVLSLEGADSIVTLAHLERAYAYGLRAVGPGHYGPGVYAQGTNAEGGIGAKGRDLLREMERLGMILDATHLCDQSFREALDHFRGRVWASHSNCRAIVDHNRQFTDDQIRELIARGAVIGAAFDAWMIVPGWIRGQSTPETAGVTLDRVIDHIDRVCQIAGNARHSGIGSDLDGGFGREQCPSDVATIADLSGIPAKLAARGYSREDVDGIMQGNFVRFLTQALPKEA
jgi:membrane dipeptidase